MRMVIFHMAVLNYQRVTVPKLLICQVNCRMFGELLYELNNHDSCVPRSSEGFVWLNVLAKDGFLKSESFPVTFTFFTHFRIPMANWRTNIYVRTCMYTSRWTNKQPSSYLSQTVHFVGGENGIERWMENIPISTKCVPPTASSFRCFCEQSNLLENCFPCSSKRLVPR